jgi:hypothetical protein
MGTSTGGEHNNSKPIADQATQIAELHVTLTKQAEYIKRLQQGQKERLAIYTKIEEKIDLLKQVRLSTADVGVLLNITSRQVRRLYKQGQLLGEPTLFATTKRTSYSLAALRPCIIPSLECFRKAANCRTMTYVECTTKLLLLG